MNNNEADFNIRADALLDNFMEIIDEALGDQLDIDLEQGILSIELDAGGQYIINKHAPTSQIWMSSPVSGATHFDFDAEQGSWVSSRRDDKLIDMLITELETATGIRLNLEP